MDGKDSRPRLLPVRMIVILDFDGTITEHDTSDALFGDFGDFSSLISELLAGNLTVAEYYTKAFTSMGSRCPPDILDTWLQSRIVDPGFVGLITWLRTKHVPVRIVSDGFDVYINPILNRLGISDVPVFSNKAVWNGVQYSPSFPGATDGCSCFCASCKRNAVLRGVGDDEVIVYVGDGRSDTCAVQHCDVVFAKGYLAAWCNEHRIPHHPYKTLADVQRILATHLTHGPLRQRRQAVLARRSAYLDE